MRQILTALAVAATIAVAPAKAETLKVGSTSTGVPFTFLDIKTNSIQGMMVDLIEAVGKEAGFTPNVSAVDFASLIPSLTSGRIDIISAAMLITPTREKVIAFSDPIVPYGEGLVVAKDDKTQYSQSLDALKGKAIGVQQGTVYLEGLRKIGGFGKIQVYDSLANMLHDLELGRIQAGMGDKPIIAYQLAQGKYDNLKLAKNYESQFGGSIGIGVRKDDEALLKRVNDALATLKKNGEIDRLVEKWNLD
jgi:polar amino acid transport system substrate-binding protein